MSAMDVLPLSPPATSSGSRKQARLLFMLSRTTSTPDDSSESGPESSSLASKKKVEFSPWADIHHSSALVTTLPESSGVKSLPPSRECQSYIKSILKSSIQDEKQSHGFDGTSDDKLSLNEVMESIVQQLSKSDNTESIDAYQTLASTIKAYDEIPDQAVLKNKLTTVTRQIRQHLGVKERMEHQPGDINLITSALKVLVILVWNTEFEALLSDDFRSFILDRSISVIAEHTAPKSVLVHYLHLLATQDFRPGLLTSIGRASRLIEALKGLTEHVKGNGVVCERLLVYQRLLDQARPVMKSRSTQWVEHMLSAMASNIADTRNKALALGRKACQAFPASSSISGSVRMALDLKQETGRTLGMSICRRLEKMVIGKDDAAQVPQIWAVILLLCNNSSMRIDAWSGLKEWLMVIQRCFNGSDSSLRLQANSAWNRFVYIARPHEASDSLVAMLSKPVAAQLERSATDKSSKASYAVAMSSYCNLLYYAFRPATTLSQYNRIWNEYIVKVMRSSFLGRSSANADIGSRILMTLLWDAKNTTKVWNENRAHENRLVEPEELPTIDCKWTRSRCSPILEIFQLLFQHSSWGLPGSQDQAYVAKAWLHFLKAIREAGSKEIKMSNETRAATVSILGFLTKIWQQQEASDIENANDSMPLSQEVLINISFVAITELGVERVLERFGMGDVVDIEPQLTDAIKRLLPFVGLPLPSSWPADGADEASPPAPVFETQFGGTPDRAVEPLAQRSSGGSKEVAVQRVEEAAATNTVENIGETDLSSGRAPSRKRHDDSQIQFVAIESSPPGAVAEDSQLLTDNQKEVRDRQREETAITFTDLRSSPRPQSRHSESRDCGFARKAATMNDRPTTPILPERHGHDPLDAHPEPSPTPKARVLRKVSEIDVPSSPPSMQGVPSSPLRQAEASVATPPHRSSSIFDTDKLNELSASQLSHDLDWSTVLEGLDTPPTASKSPLPVHGPKASTEAVRSPSAVLVEVEVSTEQVDKQAVRMNGVDAIGSQASQKKRKRPPSGYAERRRKRRKPSRSQSQSTSSQVSCFKREEEEELLDCIVVDTSSEYLGSSSPLRRDENQADEYVTSQSMEVQKHPPNLYGTAVDPDKSVIGEGGLKRRGRPRKIQSQPKQELKRSEQGSEEVLQELSPIQNVQRSRSRRTSRHRMSVEVSAEPEARRAQSIPYVLIPTVDVIAPTSDAAQPPEMEEEHMHRESDVEEIQLPPQLTHPLVATLQAALNQIKMAALGSIDLRAVDELCFQIRYQAQTAAMGRVY